jgi:Holliday junction DNA helicase RuvA
MQMIAMLSGRVVQAGSDRLIVETGGIGFEVLAPSNVINEAAKCEQIKLFTHLHVREDAMVLYGFLTATEKKTFEQLTSVSGIGPKTALAILSAVPAERLAAIIRGGDAAALKGIPGVGPKTAGRLVLELQGKFDATTFGAPAFMQELPEDDSVAALMALGYQRAAAAQAVEAARKALGGGAGADTGTGAGTGACKSAGDASSVVRHALKLLARQ